jgi:hypothetical protein
MPLTDVKALLALEIGGANGMINVSTMHYEQVRY